MFQFPIANLTPVDIMTLGAVQIMIASFHLLMWYFLFDLYSKQTVGLFGIYNPITYKLLYPSWAVCFLVSGILSLSETKYLYIHWKKLAFYGNILSAFTASVGVILLMIELYSEYIMSYRNFGKATIGRMVSTMLLLTSLLELSLSFTHVFHFCCNWASLREDKPEEVDTGNKVEEMEEEDELEAGGHIEEGMLEELEEEFEKIMKKNKEKHEKLKEETAF